MQHSCPAEQRETHTDRVRSNHTEIGMQSHLGLLKIQPALSLPHPQGIQGQGNRRFKRCLALRMLLSTVLSWLCLEGSEHASSRWETLVKPMVQPRVSSPWSLASNSSSASSSLSWRERKADVSLSNLATILVTAWIRTVAPGSCNSKD